MWTAYPLYLIALCITVVLFVASAVASWQFALWEFYKYTCRDKETILFYDLLKQYEETIIIHHIEDSL